jgi:glycosidase
MIVTRAQSATVAIAVVILLAGCSAADNAPATSVNEVEYYGTLEAFASEAVYFIVTDRFVDGDPDNNHEDQGGDLVGTFDRAIQLKGLPRGNIGYLGGDFRGVLNNARYIADMGFSAIWMTPIVDNPDEAFTGGALPGEGGSNDKGKTGYHGYWGVNFFKVDEHLESPGLAYADLTRSLRQDYGIQTILDVVVNHGSPSFTMPVDQPGYGEIYDAGDELVADHGNLHPSELDPDNLLHAFYRREPDLAELSDMDYDNPDVLEYFVAAHSKWLEQGAAAIRIDTIKHMPHYFWKTFADRIRQERPNLFMFAEAWSYDSSLIAEYTYPDKGGISVLDFPGRKAMLSIFGSKGAPYSAVQEYLQLDSGIYQNPYNLMTFYDNHDMTRIDADEAGYINAHNWLFTSRGIPVVYYGSEAGFRPGADQHSGNRDYFGQENVELARSSAIHAALTRIAQFRKESVALQRGLQANVGFSEDTAVFYRAYQKGDVREAALVLLNKSDRPANIRVSKWLSYGSWRDVSSGTEYDVTADAAELSIEVPANGVRIILFDGRLNNVDFLAELDRLQQAKNRG